MGQLIVYNTNAWLLVWLIRGELTPPVVIVSSTARAFIMVGNLDGMSSNQPGNIKELRKSP
jgi:hypothetical protein